METTELQSSGLYTESNIFALPNGAYLRANNVGVEKQNLTETVRGSIPVFTFLDQIHKNFVFKSRMLVHHGSSLAYDTTGNQTYVDYSDPVNGPNYPIYATTANQNFYFTTDTGIRKIDSLTNQPTFAGVPQGLGGPVTLITSTASVVPNGDQVAYRIVWGYRDANNNTILGAPSPRIIAANSSGSAKDVSIKAFIPDQIIAENSTKFFYQVYRSVPTLIGSAPLDELYLLDEITLTSTDLTNGFVTYADHKTTTGATIYTAPSQQGIEGSNYQPPLSKDITTYNQMNVYANIQTLQSVIMTLSKGLGDGFGYTDKTGDTNSNTDITNLIDLDNIRRGQWIEAVDIPVGTTVVNIVTPSTVNMDQSASGSNAGEAIRFMDVIDIGGEIFLGYDSDDYPNRKFKVTNDVEETAISFTNAVNSISSQYSAYYLGIGQDGLGKILIQANNFTSTFTITSTFPGAFVNNMPSTSSNDMFGHGLVISKPDQPEAVPLSTLYRLGSGEFPIERTLALRDGLYAFKQDGTWRGTGVDPVNMTFRRIDNTSNIKGAATAVVLNNNIYLHTNNGVGMCDQGGVTIISAPIRNDLQKLQGDTFLNTSFGVGYESDWKYYLFCNTFETDEVSTQAFVWNFFTETWTTQNLKPTTCGIVSYADDKMYTGNINILRQERKDYAFSDYALDEVPVNIQSFSGVTVNLVSSVGVTQGWFLVQNEGVSEIVNISGNTITLKSPIEVMTVGSASVVEPIESTLRILAHGGNPTVYKHFQQYISLHQDSRFEDLQCTFSTDLHCPNESVPVIPEIEGGFGECAFGEDGFGDLFQPPQPIQTFIPLEQARAPWLIIDLRLSQAYGKISIAGQSVVFEPMDTRYR